MCGFRRSKAMTNKQAEVMRLAPAGLSTCEIAQRLGVTKSNVRYLRAAANGKKPKSTYRYRKPPHGLSLQRQLLHLSAPRLCNSCLPDRQPSDR